LCWAPATTTATTAADVGLVEALQRGFDRAAALARDVQATFQPGVGGRRSMAPPVVV
jgi:hypothetical protein